MSANSIEDIAIRKYKTNLDFFQKNHSQLYDKLYLLDVAIEQGSYTAKYDLEYRDGYFDIKDIKSRQFLYGEDSLKYSQTLSNSVDKTKDNKVIEGFYRHHFKTRDIELAKTLDPTIGVDVCVAPLVDYLDRTTDEKTELKHIKKFIFFGVGLGTHLEYVDADIKDPAIYLIVEDDLELFRLSMFVTDYQKLSNNHNHLFFSVMDSKVEFRETFDKYFDIGFLQNSYLKYLMFSDNYQKKLEDIQTFIVGQSHMGYTYNNLLKKYINAIKPIQNGNRFLNISKHFQSNAFQAQPLLFLAAGPSLQENMQWLKNNYKNYIIVSVFMILPILEREGIEPDIIIHIDEQNHHIDKVLKQVDLFTYAKGSLFVLSPSIDLNKFERYNLKDQIFLIEDRTNYKINHGIMQGASVGDMGYALSLIFGAKDIYLLGLDLAFDKQSGKSHSDGHTTNLQVNTQAPVESKNISLRETFFKVKGNFEDEVMVNPLFQESIFYMDKFTSKYKKSYQKVYNLNNGAYFEGISPLYISDISTSYKAFDKKEICSKIKDTLEANSSLISEEELKLFDVRYQRCIEKREVLEKFSRKKFVNLEKFSNSFIEIAIEIAIVQDKSIGQMEQVLGIYLRYAGIYIIDLCNSTDIKGEKQVIKKFQKIVVEQLDKIISKYQTELEKIVLK